MIGAILKSGTFGALKGQALLYVLAGLLVAIIGLMSVAGVQTWRLGRAQDNVATLTTKVNANKVELKEAWGTASNNADANTKLKSLLDACAKENARVAGENQTAVQAAETRIASERAKGETWRQMFNAANKKPACSLILDKDFMAACGIKDY